MIVLTVQLLNLFILSVQAINTIVTSNLCQYFDAKCVTELAN